METQTGQFPRVKSASNILDNLFPPPLHQHPASAQVQTHFDDYFILWLVWNWLGYVGPWPEESYHHLHRESTIARLDYLKVWLGILTNTIFSAEHPENPSYKLGSTKESTGF